MRELLRRLLRHVPGLGARAGAPLSAKSAAGRRGENAAAAHLKRHGYRVLECNFTTRRGEVDIVAFRDGVLAFVEVRSQTEPALIDPLATVTRRKQLRVIKAAQAYCAARGLPREDVALRFDVITVLFAEGRKPKVEHVENAFGGTRRTF